MEVRKSGKRFRLGILFLTILLLCTRCSENETSIIEHSVVEKEYSSEVLQLQNWFAQQSVSENIYQKHHWSLAKKTEINEIDYVIEIPLNMAISNENYQFIATYIYINGSYTNRISAKPLKVFKEQFHHPSFVHVFSDPNQLIELSESIEAQINSYSFVAIDRVVFLKLLRTLMMKNAIVVERFKKHDSCLWELFFKFGI